MRFYPAKLMINYSDLLYKVEYSNTSINSTNSKNCSKDFVQSINTLLFLSKVMLLTLMQCSFLHLFVHSVAIDIFP